MENNSLLAVKKKKKMIPGIKRIKDLRWEIPTKVVQDTMRVRGLVYVCDCSVKIYYTSILLHITICKEFSFFFHTGEFEFTL